MVSIFADTIYDETITVNFSNGALVHDEINTKASFPTVDVTSIIGGFTYAETLVLTFEFVQPFNTTNRGNKFADARVNMQPEFLFGSNNLDLFVISKTVVENIQLETQTSGPKVTTINLDKYIDVPADLKPNLSAETVTPDGPRDVDGNQTIDIRIKVDIIGRQP
jgi:hypothetical protein